MDLFSIFLSVTTIFNNFEESYCWHQGELADPTGQEMVIATKEDAHALKTFNTNEGDKIGVSFKVHMLCHTTFDFKRAINDSYSISKK